MMQKHGRLFHPESTKSRNEPKAVTVVRCLRCPIFRDITDVLPYYLIEMSQFYGHLHHFQVFRKGWYLNTYLSVIAGEKLSINHVLFLAVNHILSLVQIMFGTLL